MESDLHNADIHITEMRIAEFSENENAIGEIVSEPDSPEEINPEDLAPEDYVVDNFWARDNIYGSEIETEETSFIGFTAGGLNSDEEKYEGLHWLFLVGVLPWILIIGSICLSVGR